MIKFLPIVQLTTSVFYNQRMLDISDEYRTKTQTGEGEDIDTDLWSFNNGMKDICIAVLYIFVWWMILITMVEKYGICFCCKKKEDDKKVELVRSGTVFKKKSKIEPFNFDKENDSFEDMVSL